MIDYKNIGKFYIGVSMPIIMNAGGVLLELGEDNESLFYKLDDVRYADVNKKGRIAYAVRPNTPVPAEAHHIIDESTLVPASSKKDIILNSGPVKRLQFKPENYPYQK